MVNLQKRDLVLYFACYLGMLPQPILRVATLLVRLTL